MASVSRNLWIANDANFAAAVEEAKSAAIERLRGEAHKRALHKSDAMLMFLLKKLDPAVFGDRAATEVHIDDSRHQTNVAVSSTSLNEESFTDEEVTTMIRLLQKAGVSLPPGGAKMSE